MLTREYAGRADTSSATSTTDMSSVSARPASRLVMNRTSEFAGFVVFMCIAIAGILMMGIGAIEIVKRFN